MEEEINYKYTPLSEPIPITEQVWPADTMPLVHTRTMTFMHEDYIRDCIEGILMQRTTFPVRVLIHDDASTDKTAEIVKEYERKHPKLIKAYYQTENSYSKPDKDERKVEFFSWRIGKYEAICEGDDYWTDCYKLQKQIDILEKNPDYSMCFHNSLIIYENTSKSSRVFTTIDKKEYDVKDIILNDWFIPTQSIVYRMALYCNTNKPEWTKYVFGGDFALQLILATKGKIGAINEIMATYRKHHGSLSVSNRKLGFHELKITESLSFFNYYTNFQYNSLIQQRILKIREKLFMSFLSELPFWYKLFNPHYYQYKFKMLMSRKKNRN